MIVFKQWGIMLQVDDLSYVLREMVGGPTATKAGTRRRFQALRMDEDN